MPNTILGHIPKVLNRLKVLENEAEMKSNEKVNTPKVANTYGVAVNPLTGKIERTKKQVK